MFPGIIYLFFLSQSEQNRNESAYTLLIVARQLSKGAAHSNSARKKMIYLRAWRPTNDDSV
jgi:hypothetical protein